MSWPEIIALAVLPAFLLLDLLKPAERGDGRALLVAQPRLRRHRLQLLAGDEDRRALGGASRRRAPVRRRRARHDRRRDRRRAGLRVLPLQLPPHGASLRRALAARPPDAPQPGEPRRLGRLLPASDRRGAVHVAVEPGAVPSARTERRGRRLGGGNRSPSWRCSSMPTCARRTGSATSCSGRKATPSITPARRPCGTTTPTCRSGTCMPFGTFRNAPAGAQAARRASTTAPRRGSSEMLAFRDVSRPVIKG